MLIEMEKRGLRPDLITFADTGGEKPGTYAFIPVFQEWLRDHDFPEAVVCRYQPQPLTHARYLGAVRDLARRLGLKLSEARLRQLAGLYGNMVANDTLPGIAFGPKSCSIKWKLEAQEPT
jgi:hypothetical protein